MSQTLFTVNKAGTAVIEKEALKLCPALRKLSVKEIQVFILWLDHQSKFKQFPKDERKRKALSLVFNDSNYPLEENNKDIAPAIEEYTSLIYDENLESLDVYRQKLSLLRRKMLTEESHNSLLKLDEVIQKLERRCKEIQMEISKGEREAEIKGGATKSVIEIWQLNRIQYLRDQANKESFKGVEIIS